MSRTTHTDLHLVAEPGTSLSSGSLTLYAMEQAEAVGSLSLYAYDPFNRRCAVGIMVANAHRRQGVATTMLLELDHLAAATFHLHQLYADIAASNEASYNLFLKAGYEKCGHFRQWLAVGDSFIDTFRMQKLI